MHELKTLSEIEVLVTTFKTDCITELNQRLFLKKVSKLIKSAITEASQTPAGRRWLKGQFAIHQNLQVIHNLAKKKTDLNISINRMQDLQKLIVQLKAFINSGINRYISG